MIDQYTKNLRREKNKKLELHEAIRQAMLNKYIDEKGQCRTNVTPANSSQATAKPYQLCQNPP